MQYLPIKTSVLTPPQDDLLTALDAAPLALQEGDILLVSSKVVSIDEGRCVPADAFDRAAQVAAAAEVIIPRPYWSSPLTITNHLLVGSAGIDQSNSDGYYTLLPADPFRSAKRLWAHLRTRFALSRLGVVVTDSHSVPCRYGAIGAAIGWWGIVPIQNHIGKSDLFGRTMRVERSNLVDGIAAGATVVMGEVAEATPVVIARDVPNIEFTSNDSKADLFVDFADDTLRVLYEQFQGEGHKRRESGPNS